MFEILAQSKDDLLAVKASGKLTAHDYEQVLLPKLASLFKQYRQLRMLLVFSDDFAGWDSTMAAWDDLKIGLEHGGDFKKIAMVGAPQWVGIAMKLFSMFVHGEIKQFSKGAQDQAIIWLKQAHS